MTSGPHFRRTKCAGSHITAAVREAPGCIVLIMTPGIPLRPEPQSMSASDKDDPSKPSGRVRHDSGGRAVWEWAVESGKHAIDSTSALLKKLELSGLRLMDDKKKAAA